MRKGISSFSAGEVSDLSDDRAAIDVVQRGLKTLTNGELGRFGHIDKRGGTDYLGELKTGTDWKLVSFDFSNFTKFQLEFGSGYVRFWSNDVQVEVTTAAWLTATAYTLGQAVSEAGTSYVCIEAHTSGVFATDLAASKWYALEGDILEVAMPYTGTEIHEFQWQSVRDFIYLTHPSHPRKVLKRYADDDWRLEDPGFEGPYEELDDEITMNASAASGSITITSDTAFFEAGHLNAKMRLFYRQEASTINAAIADVYTRASATLNVTTTDYAVGDEGREASAGEEYFYTCIATYTRTAWLTATAYVVNDMVTNGGSAYRCIEAHTSGVFATDLAALKWIIVTSASDIPMFFEAGAYLIPSTKLAGRWDFTTEGTWLGEFHTQTSADEVTWNTVNTMSTTESGTNFTTGADEETPLFVRVMLIHSDTNHSDTHNFRIGQFDVPGVAAITVVTDSLTVTATVEGGDLYGTGDAQKWEMEAFNGVDGYPRAIGFEDNRLTFAGTTRFPIDKWYSETNNYVNFIASTLAAGPFKISAIGFDSSPAQWLSSHDGAFMGTASAEATLSPQNLDSAVSPENLPVARWFSNEGSAYLPPVFLNSRLFAVQTSGERLNEFAYSIERGFNGGYDPSEATLLAEHILSSGVRQMTIRRMPEKGIWCVLNNGDVTSFTHRPKAQMAGWWRIQTTGTIKSVAIARGSGGEDDVYWAVIRDGVGYMEKMRQGNLTKRRAAEVALKAAVVAAKAGDTAAETAALATVTTNISGLGYLDGATEFTGSALTQVTGLTRYASAEVSYLRDGVARTGTVSAGGVLTLDEAADVVLVGLPYEFTAEPRSLEAFSEFGTSLSKPKTIKSVVVSYYLSVGGVALDPTGTARTVLATQTAENNPLGGTLLALQTNQTSVPLTGVSGRKKHLRITHSDPYPFTLLGLYAEIKEGTIG
jgi:hypothetical protein